MPARQRADLHGRPNNGATVVLLTQVLAKKFLTARDELRENVRNEGLYMRGTIRILRLVQGALLFSILLYLIVGEVVGSKAYTVNPALSYVLTTAGVAIVGAIFVVRRTLVLRCAQSLSSHPEDTLILNHWKTGYLATYALCEALALFGLVLRFTGSNFQQSLPYYIGGFVLLSFFGPREPAPA